MEKFINHYQNESYQHIVETVTGENLEPTDFLDYKETTHIFFNFFFIIIRTVNKKRMIMFGFKIWGKKDEKF